MTLSLGYTKNIPLSFFKDFEKRFGMFIGNMTLLIFEIKFKFWDFYNLYLRDLLKKSISFV